MAIEKTNSVVDQIATAAKLRRHHRRAAAIISCENENLDVQTASLAPPLLEDNRHVNTVPRKRVLFIPNYLFLISKQTYERL